MKVTKVVDKATAVLELYDTKFVMTSDDLDSGDWLLEVTYPELPQIGIRYFDLEAEWVFEENDIEELLWSQVFGYLKRYHSGADVTIEHEEVDSE